MPQLSITEGYPCCPLQRRYFARILLNWLTAHLDQGLLPFTQKQNVKLYSTNVDLTPWSEVI